MVAGPRLLEAEHQRFVGDLDELLRLDGHVAAQIHTAGIAVPAVQERRHVDIEDVAVLQRAVAGDAVRSEEHTSELQSLMSISSAVFWLIKKEKQHDSRT